MPEASHHIIIAELRKHGIHVTRNRIKLLQLFYTMKGAITSSQLNRATGAEVERSSVFRALELFQQKGLVVKVPSLQGERMYILNEKVQKPGNAAVRSTSYFICNDCGKMNLLEADHVGTVVYPPNLSVSHIHVVMEGICSHCGS